jgi:hypothetical protein
MSPQVFASVFAPAAAVAPVVLRRLAAALLQRASHALARAAQRVAVPIDARQTVPSAPQLEFHAEAGAPEGALYADGMLVAVLPGVSRL